MPKPPKPPSTTSKAKPKAAGKPPGLSLSKSSKRDSTPEKTTKTFSVAPLSDEGEGEKILIYGKSGMGKTTLAAQIEGAVFVALDDGARKVCNPLTRKPVNAIGGVETFADLREAVRQAKTLIDENGALVIDTLTRAQPLVEGHVIAHIPTEKGGQAKNIEHFGYGKGYRHILDQFRLLMGDLDELVRSGRHVVLLAQLDQDIVPNPAGSDYYEEVPKLIQNKQGPIRTEFCEWVDHVLRLGYIDLDVEKDNLKARAGKVISNDETRAVYSGGAQHFIAKSRPINGDRIPPVIGFEHEGDNAIWQWILGSEAAATEE